MILAHPSKPATHVVIDLSADHAWRYAVREGLAVYTQGLLTAGRLTQGLQISTKLLLEPSLNYCARFSGNQILAATGDAFDFDQAKEGSVTVTRSYLEARIQPFCDRLSASSDLVSKQRWAKRQVVLSCLFVFSSYLAENQDCGENIMI